MESGGEQARWVDVGDDLHHKDTASDSTVALHLLDDAPIRGDDQDRLEFGTYADALSSLIDNRRTQTPLTLAVNAPWGAGKSSLGNLVRHRLDTQNADGGDSPHVTCWFNAWMHDGAENITSALVSEVVRTAHAQRPLWVRAIRPLPGRLLLPRDRVRRRTILGGAYAFLIGLVTFALALVGVDGLDASLEELRQPDTAAISGADLNAPRPGVQTLEFLRQASDHPGTYATGGLFAIGLVLRVMVPTAQSIGTYLRHPSEEAERGAQASVRDDLQQLLHRNLPTGSRFVVFIDDLDRCTPENSLALLDFTNQFLAVEGVVVVLLADMDAVAVHAEQAHQNRREATPGEGRDAAVSYGRRYLRKLVQLQFDLPRQRPDRIHGLTTAWAREEVDALSREGVEVQETEEDTLAPLRTVGRVFLSVLSSPLRYVVHAYRAAEHGARRWAVGAALRNAMEPRAGLAYAIFLMAGSTLLLVGLMEGLAILLAPYGIDYLNEFEGTLVEIADAALALWTLWWLTVWVTVPAGAVHGSIGGLLHRRKANLVEHGAVSEVPGEHAGLEAYRQAMERRRRYTRLVDDSRILQHALDGARPHLPSLPRSAKRLVNGIRLQMFISQELRLLAPHGPVEAEQLGRWVVLNERWPEVGRAVRHDLGVLAALEAAAGEHDAEWARAWSGRFTDQSAPRGLRSFLAEGGLSPAVQSLLRLDGVASHPHGRHASVAV